MADQTAPMPVLEISNNATIKLEAIDPSTGDPVSGVVVSNVAISAIDLSTATTTTPAPPPLLAPALDT